MSRARIVVVLFIVACGSNHGSGSEVDAPDEIDASVCPAMQKDCSGTCENADPAHGCGDVACAPCSGGSNATPACIANACGLQCNVGFDNCDGNASNGCEKDVTSDPANCGSCNYMCPGGATCVSGACQLVAPGNGSDNACLTIDANTIYWATANANPGAVYSIAKTGGAVTPIITGAASPRGIAVDATYVYFTLLSGGQVVRCPLAGCNGAPTILAMNQSNPFGLTIDGSNVYWTNRGSGTVMQCAKTGCNLQPTTVASTQASPFAIAVDAAHVYWTNATDGTVMKADIGGGNVMMVDASGAAGARGIAVDTDAVYYTQAAQGLVVKVPFTGAKQNLALGQASPWGLATDGTNAYWSSSAAAANGGAIVKAPLTSGAAVTRAASQAYPLCVAVDATTIYWINAGGNAIQKVAK